ncbi:MAG: permease prefix domain 1-containing protein [Blastocatellia bacterium]
MTWWHGLWLRKKMEEELEKELRFHLDQHTADLIAQGLDPEEARRRARLALGGPEQVPESALRRPTPISTPFRGGHRSSFPRRTPDARPMWL